MDIEPPRPSSFFARFAEKITKFSGSTLAFINSLGLVAVWALTGPVFNYSETWQLVINTGTTIITFLMIFLIQRAQNKEILGVAHKKAVLPTVCRKDRFGLRPASITQLA
jgi:low affinity Fe/Cu permease